MSGSRARSSLGRARTTHPQRDGRFFSGYRGCSQAGPSSVLSHHHRGTERSVLLRRRLQRTGTRDRLDPRSPRRRRSCRLPPPRGRLNARARRARPGVRTGVDDRRPMSGQVRRRSRVRRPRPPGVAAFRSRNPTRNRTPRRPVALHVASQQPRSARRRCLVPPAARGRRRSLRRRTASSRPLRCGRRLRECVTDRPRRTALTDRLPRHSRHRADRQVRPRDPPDRIRRRARSAPHGRLQLGSILLTVPWHSDRRGARRHRAMPR